MPIAKNRISILQNGLLDKKVAVKLLNKGLAICTDNPCSPDQPIYCGRENVFKTRQM